MADQAKPNDPSSVGQTVVVDPAQQTNQGGTQVKIPEFLSSKMSQEEFNALPESARTVLVERSRDLQEDYRQKTTELSNTRKQLDGLASIQKQLDDNPDLAKHIEKSIKDFQSGKKSGASSASDSWEQLKSEADREGLRVLEAIEKHFSHEPVMAKLEELGNQFKQFSGTAQASRQSQLEQEIANLPKEFQQLASEHRDAVVRLGISMPNKTARELLGLYALNRGISGAFEDAVFAERTRKSKEQVETAKTLGGFPSNAGQPEIPTLTKDDWQESRDPRFGGQLKIGNVVTRVFDSVKRHMPGV